MKNNNLNNLINLINLKNLNLYIYNLIKVFKDNFSLYKYSMKKVNSNEKKINHNFIMNDKNSIFKTCMKVPVYKGTKIPMIIAGKFQQEYLNITPTHGNNAIGTVDSYVSFQKITEKNDKGRDIITGYKNIKKDNKYNLNKVNYAILTGSPNKLYVVDLDTHKWNNNNNHIFIKFYSEKLNIQITDDFDTNMNNIIDKIDTFTVKTPSGGFHLYFHYTTNTNIAKFSKCEIDFLGEAAQVIGFDSYVRNKGKYIVIKNTNIKEFTKVHNDFIDELTYFGLDEKTKNKKIKSKNKIKSQNFQMDMTLWEYYFDETLYNNIYKKVKLNEKYFDKNNEEYSFDNFLKITTFFKFISEKYKCVKKDFDKICKKYAGYDKENNDKIYNSIDINKVINKYQPKCIISIILYEIGLYHLLSSIKYRSLIPNTIEPDEIIDSTGKKGISEVFTPEKNKNYVIKSGTNTGKTYMMNEYHHKTKTPMIIICSRVSLAKEFKEKFSEKNIDYNIDSDNSDISEYDDENEEYSHEYILYDDYRNLKDFNQFEGSSIIIQVDSLLKIKYFDFSQYIVFIDELQSVYQYMDTSTTIDKKRIEIDMCLKDCIRTCKQFIGCDADIMDDVLYYLQPKNYDGAEFENASPNLEYTYIQNIYCPYKNVVAEEIFDYNVFMDLVKKEEKFMVCSDSATEIRNLSNYLKKMYKEDEYNITLEEDLDITLIDRLYNGDINLDKINRLMFSPKVIYGNDSVMCRKVFCLYKGHTISAKNMLQQVSRCRNIEYIYFHFINKETILRDFEFNSPADVIERVNYLDKYSNLLYNDDDIEISLDQKFYNKRMSYHLFNSDSDRTNKYLQFKLGLINMGCKIVDKRIEKTINLKKSTKKILKEMTDKQLIDHFTENIDSEYYTRMNEIIKIPDDKKEDYTELFINPQKIHQHINFTYLFIKSIEKGFKKTKECYKENYAVNVSWSDENKIVWLKNICDELKINFDEKFEINEELSKEKIIKYQDEYKKLFRVDRKNFSFDDKKLLLECIKTQLCSICGEKDLFKKKSREKTINKQRYRWTEYILNKPIYEYHKQIYSYRCKKKLDTNECLITDDY